MTTLSPGLRVNTYEDAIPGGTGRSLGPCSLGTLRSKGGVAIRTLSFMTFFSAGYEAMEYALIVGSVFTHSRLKKPYFSQSFLYSGSTSMSLKYTWNAGMSIWMYSPLLNSMCSPSGSLTVNSLMKVDTFLLEITSHSSFLTESADSATCIFRLSLTLTWQPRRQPSLICLRLKNPTSVGSISPPPSNTCTLHWPQLALPPQAEGRKIFSFASVVIRLLPGVTSRTFLPSLMSIFIVPLGVIASLTTRSSTTRNRVTITIIATAEKTVALISLSSC